MMNLPRSTKLGFIFLSAISIAPLAAVGGVTKYRVIEPTMAGQTVTLTGSSLTIDKLVAIARYGAKVDIGPEIVQGAAESFGLVLEAQAEGVPVYLFNRSPGSGREVVSLTGDPESTAYKNELARRYADNVIAAGEGQGFGEDISDEAVGRAMLVVDLNHMRYLAASPPFVRGIAELLNHGVTPAVKWRGQIGESDFVPTGEVLRGRGFAYYRGERLPASEALAKAGLKPIRFDGPDANLVTTSALTAGFAALLVSDVRRLIEWHDLIWALELNGMNGSIGPLSWPVQSTRPFPWANFAARRELNMLKNSYVFNGEKRTIQDPESLRATVWRDAAVWQAWAQLRDDTLIQMNSTDHNPASIPNVKPEDSWELSTPELMKYYVRGGKYSGGRGGYILSNSDWDPYPLAYDVEALPIALTNLMVAVVQRLHRFEDPFFTVTDAGRVLHDHPDAFGASRQNGSGGGGGIADALWQELKPLANPIAPDGVTADKGVGDLDAVPVQKLMRLQQAVDISRDLLGQNLYNAAFWLDIRKLEKSDRSFGDVPTAIWKAYRNIVPFRPSTAPSRSPVSWSDLSSEFLRSHAPTEFYPSEEADMPGGSPQIPLVRSAGAEKRH